MHELLETIGYVPLTEPHSQALPCTNEKSGNTGRAWDILSREKCCKQRELNCVWARKTAIYVLFYTNVCRSQSRVLYGL